MPQVSVHVCAGDAASQSRLLDGGAQPTNRTFLAALIPAGTQWLPSQLAVPTNVVIYFVKAATAYGSSPASIGLCRFIVDPEECNRGLAAAPTVTSSALPSDHCNSNGSCESVFGENYANCIDCQN